MVRSLFILDIGHGNAAVLIDDEGVVVIDAGPRSALLEFLTRAEIGKIDVLLISHSDEDHIAGALALLSSEEFEICTVRLNSDAQKDSALWDDLLYTLDKAHGLEELDFNISLTNRDSHVYSHGAIDIEILAPSLYLAGRGPGSTDRKGRRITTNSMSAVIRLVRDGHPIALLPGDIDATGLDNLEEDGVDCSAPIAVFPHHGGRPGDANPAQFAAHFCDLVQPETVIFSIGRGKHSTPRPEIVEQIRRHNINVRVACTQLSQHCSALLPLASADYTKRLFALGSGQRKCCAGTIMVNLASPLPEVTPTRLEHEAWIDANVPTPMCRRPAE